METDSRAAGVAKARRVLRFVFFGCFLVFLGLGGRSSVWAADAAPASGGKRLQVLTSFLPIYCFTANVAGELADVVNLLPANVGPHDYQPTPSDERKLRTADLLVLNGLQLESWHEKLVRSRARRKQPLPVVEVWKGLESQLIRSVPTLHIVDGGGSHAHDHSGDANPHLWLDPMLATHAVTNVLRALQQADPANASGYALNAERFTRKLVSIHDGYVRGLAVASNAPIVVFHDAFVYAAKRYGLRIVGVIEQTPEVTPSPRYLGELKRVIEREHIRVIFAEPQFPAKLARQLALDTKVPLALLDTMETAFDGVLKPDSYERAMEQNLKVLREHLK